ncbi:tryptophan synthase subunit alpha [Actinomyces minihominis]|uniref:tryptophan synthase subunit alpha n=1 Tax=Actinomyces minihominis TaxID=2002838 RepID=UPI000C069D99|nr:tryptophan synthase subunit alpha [Actinomyces minihominis]
MRHSSEAIRRELAAGNAALIAYLPLGYPTVEKSLEAARVLAANGVDAFELGFPYSDPAMDGPVIERAVVEALEHGTHLEDLFAVTKSLSDDGIPALSMTYWNPVHWYGVERFSRTFAEAGGAGLITPDLPPEEAAEWVESSDRWDLERVFLAAPSSSDERLKIVSKATNSWIYAASTMGVTGQRGSVDQSARNLVQRCRDAGAPLVCVGIGVSTKKQAREISAYADGVIVGSAFVKLLANPDWERALLDAGALARELKEGTRNTK